MRRDLLLLLYGSVESVVVVVVVVCLENVIFIKIFQSAKFIIESVTSLPMTRSVRLSVGKSLCLLVACQNFLKGRKITLPRSNRMSTIVSYSAKVAKKC